MFCNSISGGDATVVPGAFDALADEIARLDAHVVALCEVNNHDGVTSERLVEARSSATDVVRSFGTLHRRAGNRCLRAVEISDRRGRDGTFNRSGRCRYESAPRRQRVRCPALSGHLDYTHYACYLPRGYDGVTWRKLPAPDSDPQAVLRMNRASTRDEAIAAFLEEVSRERADLILLAGDFNEPSHLDWTDATRAMWDHDGCSFPGTAP